MNIAPRGSIGGFSKRTMKNLQQIETLACEKNATGERLVHPMTQIANSLLGLIVFPYEECFKKDPAFGGDSLDHLYQLGWPKWAVTIADPSQPTGTLHQLMRHLRNAIAHRGMTFTDEADASKVTITAKNFQCDINGDVIEGLPPTWQATIKGSGLRTFCSKLEEKLQDE